MDEVPQEVKEIALNAKKFLLPQKSKDRYELVYDAYRKWCEKMKITKTSEDSILAYFNSDLANCKSSTLWSKYSILRSTINLKGGVDIKIFPSIIPFLKRKGDGYKAKKSLILTKENVEIFLTGADDEHHLLNKVIVAEGYVDESQLVKENVASQILGNGTQGQEVATQSSRNSNIIENIRSYAHQSGPTISNSQNCVININYCNCNKC